MTSDICSFCKKGKLTTLFQYNAPPEGETRFNFSNSYRREALRCSHCGHIHLVHNMDLAGLYEHSYVDATYGDRGLKATFDRIASLPREKSDNTWRVDRVNSYASRWFERPISANPRLTVLDVGSGIAIFPYAMRLAGWQTMALDPDERAVRHARETAGVECVHTDFFQVREIGRFDLVSFNKVLEHVKEPGAMLRLAHEVVRPGGLIYVELPDGEAAAAAGAGRQEFFVEHFHAFSEDSMKLLASQAEFKVEAMERIREPSDKFTWYMFLSEP